MLNLLDLLVIVFMILAAVSLLAMSLMFLVRNPKIKKICFFIVGALGIYLGYVGIRIGWGLFAVQIAIGAMVALASIGALIAGAKANVNDKKFRIAQLIAAAALVAGMFNAFL